MPSSPDMGMGMATATTTSSASFALDAVTTEAASAASGSGSMGHSSSMSMGGMSSYLHFGIGDPFLASSFTPAGTSGYVAVMFLLMLLAILQRLLLAFTANAGRKLSAHVQPSYRAESDTKSGSWIEVGEDVRPAEDLATRLKVSVPRAISRGLLQVLNAAMGFLVLVPPSPIVKFVLTQAMMAACSVS